MSGLIGIIDAIDRGSSISLKDEIPDKDLCMLVILVARYHVLVEMGREGGVEYDIYEGKYLKKPMYVIRSKIGDGKPIILFRVDVKTKDIYWRGGRKPRSNLLDTDYTFEDGVLYDIDDSRVSKVEYKKAIETWDRYGLVADSEAMKEEKGVDDEEEGVDEEEEDDEEEEVVEEEEDDEEDDEEVIVIDSDLAKKAWLIQLVGETSRGSGYSYSLREYGGKLTIDEFETIGKSFFNKIGDVKHYSFDEYEGGDLGVVFYTNRDIEKDWNMFVSDLVDKKEVVIVSSDRDGEIEFLETPEEGSFHDMQGRRRSMEDAHVIAKFDNIELYGVFDGHGGRAVADMVAEDLPRRIKKWLENVDTDDEDSVKAAIKTAFLEMDQHIFDKFQGNDGSTAIVAIVIKDKVYIANLGDSRAVIFNYEDGEIVLATDDHKPNDPEERKRAEEAGSGVIMGRVGGILAVSRAFGDNSLKEDQYGNYGKEKAPVSPEPDVYVFQREEGKTYAIILACDGLWDEMTNKDVGYYMKKHGVVSNNPAYDLVQLAFKKGSNDNISVMTIDLLD